jgi:hypothetical protein
MERIYKSKKAGINRSGDQSSGPKACEITAKHPCKLSFVLPTLKLTISENDSNDCSVLTAYADAEEISQADKQASRSQVFQLH